MAEGQEHCAQESKRVSPWLAPVDVVNSAPLLRF